MARKLVIYTVISVKSKNGKISYAVVDIVASTKSELSQMSQVNCLSYSYGYSLTENSQSDNE